MPMQVQHAGNLRLPRNLLELPLDGPHLRMQASIRFPPIPIQVKPPQITPKIAIDNPINIDHRKYLEHVIFQQVADVWVFIFRKQVEDLLHHEGGPGLAGVLAG